MSTINKKKLEELGKRADGAPLTAESFLYCLEEIPELDIAIEGLREIVRRAYTYEDARQEVWDLKNIARGTLKNIKK